VSAHPRDEVLSYDDVRLPAGRTIDALRSRQQRQYTDPDAMTMAI